MAKLFSEIVDYRVRDEFGGETLRLLRVLFQNRDRACHAEARRRREGADHRSFRTVGVSEGPLTDHRKSVRGRPDRKAATP